MFVYIYNMYVYLYMECGFIYIHTVKASLRYVSMTNNTKQQVKVLLWVKTNAEEHDV